MRPEKILVVDDEKRIVDNIARCLNREGFRVTGAFSGEEALSLFRAHGFDLVLLDISLPGMDGYDVMAQILSLDPDALIIFMTGFATVESSVKALKQGAWDYLKKPFEYADLAKTVKNAVTQINLMADKKAFAARLEASERQYAFMVNNSPDLIFTLDAKGCIAFVNDQCEKVLGILKQDLIGSAFGDLLHEDDQVRARHLSRAVRPGKGRRPRSFEFNVRFKKAGQRLSRFDSFSDFVFMELKASPIILPGRDPGTKEPGVYAVARDVTDRLKLEAQLRQAQKMEAIGTLAGGIAHDFNNILMGIQGYASLVKCGLEPDSDAYKRLSNIDEYVSSGAEMARQLLGFAQKSSQESSPMNLNYLLKMSAKMFGRTKKDIIIRQNLEKKLWNTVVDEGQIKQVLMNLFVNAWQAMPSGGRITVMSENILADQGLKDELGLCKTGPHVKISVADTGSGMDKATMARIFDPFFTTKERGQGTGLGLATAYGIIKSHKGAFAVASEPGQGAVLMFFLPATKAPVRAWVTSDDNEKIIAGKGRILLVDDEKGVIDVCSEMLETLGYEVLAAESGSRALKILARERQTIDLVILDMVMPGMNGFETYEQIRLMGADIRVLVCSGYSKEEEVRQMIKNGCDDYIFKPFDVAMLSEKLQSLFSVSKA